VKVGDLVKLRRGYDLWWGDESVGVLTDLSEPTLMFPFQVATVAFGTQIFEGVSTRSLEVVSESR
jgi:hypothetical protein